MVDTANSPAPAARSGAGRKVLVGLGWVATTIGAAVLGSYSTSFLDRARPYVAVSDIRPSPPTETTLDPDVGRLLGMEQAFVDELRRSNWFRWINPRTDTMDQLVDELNGNRVLAGSLLDDMKKFEDFYPRAIAMIGSMPSQSSAEAFLDEWSKVDNYIYNVLGNAMVKGTLAAPGQKPYDPGRKFLAVTDEPQTNGLFSVVRKRSGSGAPSAIKLKGPDLNDRLREVSLALATFDAEVLRLYLDTVKADADHRHDVEYLSSEFATYLDGLSRWSVTALVTNSGSKPISILPDAKLYVQTDKIAKFTADTVIPMIARDTGQRQQAITVSGGETKVVTLVSERLIASTPEWKALMSQFKEHSTNCFVAVHIAGDPWIQTGVLISEVRSFGEQASRDQLSQEDVRRKFKGGN